MYPQPDDVDEPPDDDGGGVSRLRPYVLTSGRAEPVDQTLEIEAQVQTTDLGASVYGGLAFEYREIVDLCRATMPVAEVAARVGLHIGVVRVLVADLAAQGYLLVHRPRFAYSQDRDLIERVVRGLQSIR